MRFVARPNARALVVVWLTVLGGTSCGAPPGSAPSSAPASSTIVPVTRVVDGDTIHVTFEGHDERVRFIGINTPEIAHDGNPAECFGDRAADYLRRRLDGATVRLVFDVDLRDRYGRLLAYVYQGHELLNLTLVREGYALALAVRPDTRMTVDFERAENEARTGQRGLWEACPTPGS
jgi:micrococcal nuclease